MTASNTALGYQAGYSDISGNGNTYLGIFSDIDNSQNIYSNSTAIGCNSRIGQSNSIILGDSSNTSLKVGIKTNNPSSELEVIGTITTTDLNVNDTLTVANVIKSNTIQSLVNSPLTIRGSLSGNTNVVFDASRVIISDLSVNTHASIL